ncbi:MAG: hypothetical protein CMF51_02295 [Legionellales bacterium]|nr:hypothetical protein [Legionellales bacterium]
MRFMLPRSWTCGDCVFPQPIGSHRKRHIMAVGKKGKRVQERQRLSLEAAQRLRHIELGPVSAAAQRHIFVRGQRVRGSTPTTCIGGAGL